MKRLIILTLAMFLLCAAASAETVFPGLSWQSQMSERFVLLCAAGAGEAAYPVKCVTCQTSQWFYSDEPTVSAYRIEYDGSGLATAYVAATELLRDGVPLADEEIADAQRFSIFYEFDSHGSPEVMYIEEEKPFAQPYVYTFINTYEDGTLVSVALSPGVTLYLSLPVEEFPVHFTGYANAELDFGKVVIRYQDGRAVYRADWKDPEGIGRFITETVYEGDRMISMTFSDMIANEVSCREEITCDEAGGIAERINGNSVTRYDGMGNEVYFEYILYDDDDGDAVIQRRVRETVYEYRETTGGEG